MNNNKCVFYLSIYYVFQKVILFFQEKKVDLFIFGIRFIRLYVYHYVVVFMKNKS